VTVPRMCGTQRGKQKSHVNGGPRGDKGRQGKRPPESCNRGQLNSQNPSDMAEGAGRAGETTGGHTISSCQWDRARGAQLKPKDDRSDRSTKGWG